MYLGLGTPLRHIWKCVCAGQSSFSGVYLSFVRARVESWKTVVVLVEPVLDELIGRGCRFVVVGSAARWLLGEQVPVNDLDIVVEGSVSNRAPVIDALVAVGGVVERRRGRRALGPGMSLPWEWGWRTSTAHGDVDVVVRFIDGSGYEDHDRAAVPVTLGAGGVVRCHPTRHP